MNNSPWAETSKPMGIQERAGFWLRTSLQTSVQYVHKNVHRHEDLAVVQLEDLGR
jgi:hypothetical protein